MKSNVRCTKEIGCARSPCPFAPVPPCPCAPMPVPCNPLSQISIMATGHYGFFNALTICLCILLLDDQQLPWAPQPAVLLPWLPAPEALGVALAAVGVGVTLLFALVQGIGLLYALRGRVIPPEVLTRLHYRFNDACGLGNAYGLFPVMTTTREEVCVPFGGPSVVL